jgi:hypothetical protein
LPDLPGSRARVNHRRAGVLALVQDTPHDDGRVVGLVVIDDVLLDLNAAATQEEIVSGPAGFGVPG